MIMGIMTRKDMIVIKLADIFEKIFYEKKGESMKTVISMAIIVFAVSVTLMFTACEKKGPAEKVGEKIDQAVDKTTDAAKDAKKKVEESLK